MLIRHITAAANVDHDGYLIDPCAVRHGVIIGGRVAALAGLIDPVTHLNRDFEEHDLGRCVVAEQLEVGAAVEVTEDGLRLVGAADGAYVSRGEVDLAGRRTAWREAVARRRTARGR
jgi:hypothetical protein